MVYGLLGSLFLTVGTSCKPTEKGYQAAYDAAKNKREAAMEAMPVDNKVIGALQLIDGPTTKFYDGKEYPYMAVNLKPVDDQYSTKGKYNVAVALFKMPTNSEALANDLKVLDYNSFVAQDGDDKYYVIAGSFENLSEAAQFYENLTKNYNRAYVGLGESPLIIFSGR